MASCTLESRQTAAQDMVTELLKEKGKDLKLEQVAPYKFRVTPNKANPPKNLLLRLSQLQGQVSTALENGSDAEFKGKFAYGWVTRKQLTPRYFELEVKVPDIYTKALEVKLGAKSLEQVNREINHDRTLKYFNYDAALYEQERREDRLEEENDIFVNPNTGLPEWSHNPAADKNVTISDADLFELMKIKKC